MDYEILFESERIYFIKLTEKLVNEYLDMVNDIEVQKYSKEGGKEYAYRSIQSGPADLFKQQS